MIRRLALALLAAQPAAAQEAPTEPPATATALAFAEEGPRMTVPVRIAGGGPFDFIVDTGAQRTVVSRELAQTLALSAGRNLRLTAMTGTYPVATVIVPALSVSVLGAERIEAPVLERRDLGALGILGIDTLQGQSVRIDFDINEMAITPTRKRARREPPPGDEIVVRARSLFGQLVVTDARVGNTRVRVVLDTGSVVSMGNEALRRRVLRGARGPQIALLSVTGGVLVAEQMALPTIRIGELTVNDLPVAIADAAPFRAFGLERTPALLLGMDALRLFRRVDIDFANRELRLALPRGVRRPSEPLPRLPDR